MLEDRKETPETYFRLAQNLLTLMSTEEKSKRSENLLCGLSSFEKPVQQM